MSKVKEVSITIKFTTGYVGDTLEKPEQWVAGVLCGKMVAAGIIKENPVEAGSGLFEMEILKMETKDI